LVEVADGATLDRVREHTTAPFTVEIDTEIEEAVHA